MSSLGFGLSIADRRSSHQGKLSPLSTSLHFWPMYEKSGNQLEDVVGGAPLTVYSGKALDFVSASSSYASVNIPWYAFNLKELTFRCSYYPKAPTGNGHIINTLGNGVATNGGFYIRDNIAGNLTISVCGVNGASEAKRPYVLVAYNIPDSSWHSLRLSFYYGEDDTPMSDLFVDDVLIETINWRTDPASPSDAIETFTLGTSQPTIFGKNGTFSDSYSNMQVADVAFDVVQNSGSAFTYSMTLDVVDGLLYSHGNDFPVALRDGASLVAASSGGVQAMLGRRSGSYPGVRPAGGEYAASGESFDLGSIVAFDFWLRAAALPDGEERTHLLLGDEAAHHMRVFTDGQSLKLEVKNASDVGTFVMVEKLTCEWQHHLVFMTRTNTSGYYYTMSADDSAPIGGPYPIFVAGTATTSAFDGLQIGSPSDGSNYDMIGPINLQNSAHTPSELAESHEKAGRIVAEKADAAMGFPEHLLDPALLDKSSPFGSSDFGVPDIGDDASPVNLDLLFFPAVGTVSPYHSAIHDTETVSTELSGLNRFVVSLVLAIEEMPSAPLQIFATSDSSLTLSIFSGSFMCATKWASGTKTATYVGGQIPVGVEVQLLLYWNQEQLNYLCARLDTGATIFSGTWGTVNAGATVNASTAAHYVIGADAAASGLLAIRRVTVIASNGTYPATAGMNTSLIDGTFDVAYSHAYFLLDRHSIRKLKTPATLLGASGVFLAMDDATFETKFDDYGTGSCAPGVGWTSSGSTFSLAARAGLVPLNQRVSQVYVKIFVSAVAGKSALNVNCMNTQSASYVEISAPGTYYFGPFSSNAKDFGAGTSIDGTSLLRVTGKTDGGSDAYLRIGTIEIEGRTVGRHDNRIGLSTFPTRVADAGTLDASGWAQKREMLGGAILGGSGQIALGDEFTIALGGVGFFAVDNGNQYVTAQLASSATSGMVASLLIVDRVEEKTYSIDAYYVGSNGVVFAFSSLGGARIYSDGKLCVNTAESGTPLGVIDPGFSGNPYLSFSGDDIGPGNIITNGESDKNEYHPVLVWKSFLSSGDIIKVSRRIECYA